MGKHYYGWHTVDWSKGDREIALGIGYTAEGVRARRKAFGIPPGPRAPYTVRALRASRFKWAGVNWSGVDWTQPNDEIAKQVGCCADFVSKKRRLLGLPRPARKKNCQQVRLEKFWSGIDWRKPTVQIAKETGRHWTIVCRWRRRVGHPPEVDLRKSA